MKKNLQLTNLRISTELKEKISLALKLINSSKSNIEVSEPGFRRMALSHFCEQVIGEGIEISIKPKI